MRTRKIKIIIEKSIDAFSAYTENVEGGYGMGDTAEEAKKNAIKGLELYKKYNKNNLPAILKAEYEFVFKYDTQSFLTYYKKIFTNAALERMTGINQKQFQHYASGLKKPRQAQVKKIEAAMHELGRELMAVEL